MCVCVGGGRCDDGVKCVPWSYMCDGWPTCADSSDEDTYNCNLVSLLEVKYVFSS